MKTVETIRLFYVDDQGQTQERSHNVLHWLRCGNETRRMESGKMEQTICLISPCYIMHRR